MRKAPIAEAGAFLDGVVRVSARFNPNAASGRALGAAVYMVVSGLSMTDLSQGVVERRQADTD